MSQTCLYLVDSSPYVFRAYFALPPTLRAPDGREVHAVYGFTDTLIRLLRTEDPSHLAVTFDESLNTSFRNDFYPEYKAQRELPPPELEAQLADCRRVAEALGAACFSSSRYEADDLIATLLDRHGPAVDRAVIVTSDKDLAQLVTERVCWYDLARSRRLGPREVHENFGVPASKMLDLLSLRGDPVDNIPGVKGIGDKTARALLENFEGLDELYARLEEVESLPIRGAKSVRRKLEEGREVAELSRRLAALATNAPVEAALDDLRWGGADPTLCDEVFEDLGFSGLRDRAAKLKPNQERS